MALANSKEAPLPLGRMIFAVKDWVGRLGEVWVEGQIVEIKRRNAPTQFLTLRDRRADVSCDVTASAFVLDSAGPIPDGAEVVARLKAQVWERSGRLSFECLELHIAGEGRLLASLEQLKRKLQAEGLFDPARKKKIPFLPKGIGLLTGRNSDAERDVLTNIYDRWPAANVVVEYATVQGPSAAASVMQALAKLDADERIDVIILARGGGSLEDLLAFSDEGLVRAVAVANTPVITGIGHEPDTPIVDYAADLRASTPTDAAKRVVPDVRQESAIIAEGRSRLMTAVEALLEREQTALDGLRSRPVMLNPTAAFDAHYDRLVLLRHQLLTFITNTIRDEQATLSNLITSVRAMSPKHTLERGYAVLVTEDGESIASIHEAFPEERIHAYVADGVFELDVVDAHERTTHG